LASVSRHRAGGGGGGGKFGGIQGLTPQEEEDVLTVQNK